MENMMKYFIVDVFSEGKYTGNPLAVFNNAGHISDTDMQQIAKEINYSETTFITSESNDHSQYDVRIFTPTQEIPFAGHPTLGTAFIIQNEIVKEPLKELVLHFKGGQIPVTFNHQDEVIWMKQNEPTFGRILDANKVSDVLHIARKTM